MLDVRLEKSRITLNKPRMCSGFRFGLGLTWKQSRFRRTRCGSVSGSLSRMLKACQSVSCRVFGPQSQTSRSIHPQIGRPTQTQLITGITAVKYSEKQLDQPVWEIHRDDLRYNRASTTCLSGISGFWGWALPQAKAKVLRSKRSLDVGRRWSPKIVPAGYI
jgi:hypothetical protein